MKNKSVVILAGGLCPSDLQEHAGVKYVADLPFGETSMVQRIVAAFREAGFENVIVVGTNVKGCTYVEAGDSFVDSLRGGLAAAKTTDMIFVATCDMPFLQAAEISAFAQSRQLGSTLCCAVVPVEVCSQHYPELVRTGLTVLEGKFTLGNIFAGEMWVWRHALKVAQKAYQARKNKLKLALMLGLPTTVRYLRAKKNPAALSIEQLEQRGRKIVGCNVRAVIGDWPGIGTDVDNQTHYQEALKYLEEPIAAG